MELAASGCDRILYSEGAVQTMYLLGEHGVSGRIYVLGGGLSRPLREYIEILRDVIGPTLLLGLGEAPYGPQQVMHLEAGITAIQEKTGFVPQAAFPMDTITKMKE